MARTEDRFLVRESKDTTVAGEVWAVKTGETIYGIAGADGNAEKERKAAEDARKAAETARVSAESARASAESARADAEQKRAQAESARADAQAKNNADQALNNEAMKKLAPVILQEGQYDPDSLAPTIEGEANRMYLVPMSKAVAATLGISERAVESGNSYAEWMWIGGKWELMGESTIKHKSISTDQIDSVFADESPTGDETLTLTGLSYVWAKISAWAKGAFAAITHKHGAADITSGTLPIARGGTGGATAEAARAALGASSQADTDALRESLSRAVKFRLEGTSDNPSLYYVVPAFGTNLEVWVSKYYIILRLNGKTLARWNPIAQ